MLLIWGAVFLMRLSPVTEQNSPARLAKRITLMPAGYCLSVPEKCAATETKNKVFLYCEDGTGGELALNLKPEQLKLLSDNKDFKPVEFFDSKGKQLQPNQPEFVNNLSLEGRQDYFLGDLNNRNLYQVYILYKDRKKAFGMQIKKCP